jgi:hypothetical protein
MQATPKIEVLGQQFYRTYKKRDPNNFDFILGRLEPFQGRLRSLVVESTCNFYRLVDGLMDAWYPTVKARADAAVINDNSYLRWALRRHLKRHAASIAAFAVTVIEKRPKPIRYCPPGRRVPTGTGFAHQILAIKLGSEMSPGSLRLEEGSHEM